MSNKTHSNSISKRPKLKLLRLMAIGLLGLVLFIAGGAVGGGTATILIFNHLKQRSYNPRIASRQVVKQLQHRLHLSPKQTKQIYKIITNHEKKISQLREDAHSDIYAQIKQIRSDIANVLKPKQKKKWLAFFDRMNKRWAPNHRKYPHSRRPFHKYKRGEHPKGHYKQRYKRQKDNKNAATFPTSKPSTNK